MAVASRGFQVFVRPAGAACNLACRYCYYLGRGPSGPVSGPARMPEDLLEDNIAQHIAASPDEIIRFSWHGVPTDILCVVSAANVGHPAEVYGFFKGIGASYVTFLPLVEPRPDEPGGVSLETVPAEAWGDFLCAVFGEWVDRDIGRIKIQIVEEAARTAFGQEHGIWRPPPCQGFPLRRQ